MNKRIMNQKKIIFQIKNRKKKHLKRVEKKMKKKMILKPPKIQIRMKKKRKIMKTQNLKKSLE